MRITENALHPTLLRLTAEMMSATALDAALKAHPKRGFSCMIDESDTLSAELLTARGFTSVRRTVEGVWRGDPTMPLPKFEHGTLAQRPDLTTPWLAAHRQHYFASHRANPPAVLDDESWDNAFLGEDFSPESAIFILDENNIAAFSSLRKARDGWEQAWFGTIPYNHPEFATLNAGLVALETAFMAKRGIRSALVEWDTTSHDAAWRIRQYPLQKLHAYLTFTRAM